MSGQTAYLVLADGLTLRVEPLGAPGQTVGEAVFTTGMTGYHEVLTDPSYHGQIVAMTAAQIGNTGIAHEDAESADEAPRVSGFVVHDASEMASNWRSNETLDAYLRRHGVVGIRGVDTTSSQSSTVRWRVTAAPRPGSGASTPISGCSSAIIQRASPTASSTWPMRPSGISIGSTTTSAPSAATYHSTAARASGTAR